MSLIRPNNCISIKFMKKGVAASRQPELNKLKHPRSNSSMKSRCHTTPLLHHHHHHHHPNPNHHHRLFRFPCYAQVGRFPPIKLLHLVLSNAHSFFSPTDLSLAGHIHPRSSYFSLYPSYYQY